VSDPFDLQRFVDAQEPVYRRVVEELRRGRKASHWMWFVFPQIAGLGFSAMAQRFAIGSRAEATAYLQHEVLGPRLVECARLVVAARDKFDHRYSRVAGRHEVSVEHDAVRRGLDAVDIP